MNPKTMLSNYYEIDKKLKTSMKYSKKNAYIAKFRVVRIIYQTNKKYKFELFLFD